jgi:hypothetical protein
MKAAITGATGLLGRALLAELSEAVVLSRDPARASRELGVTRAIAWRPELEATPQEAMEGADVVFNLAGEPVADGRWTDAKKGRIKGSRVVGTRNLIAGLSRLDRRPRVLVSASAVGYYGDRGDDELDEASPAGQGFLPRVCGEWEREATAAERLGIRVVCMRIGIVLAPGGGALARMVPPFKTGAGGRLGDGKQWMPWIHIDDVVGLLLHAGRSEDVRGAMNAVSPHPATNATFTRALGRALHRPALLPVPRTVLRIAFGEMSQILTSSQRVLPQVALRTGYVFKHPHLDAALAAVLSARARTAA